MIPPIITQHEGVFVVRDDLFLGGTKARFLPVLFEQADEVVYASPAEGGAQTALAHTAAKLGKRATIFVAKRSIPHNRALEAKRLGAKVMQVQHGYLNVVQARAREYCKRTGAFLAPFGVNLPEAISVIAAAAKTTGIQPNEVWCASGSGVLARSLAKAWPNSKRHVVQVGRELSTSDVAGAIIHKSALPFQKAIVQRPPFPSDPHYDAKAWAICRVKKGKGIVLFWNVTGPAIP
jgi:threonine dehydratase